MKRLVGRGFDAEIEAYYHRQMEDGTLSRAGWTPLHVAASRGQLERLTELLHERQVNASAKDGRTPLHVAAAEGKPQVVKLLLDAGADQKATG